MRVRTKLFGDRAFAKAAPELWNSLPQLILTRIETLGCYAFSKKRLLLLSKLFTLSKQIDCN